MTRTELLNLIANYIYAETYLEIGVQRGVNFQKVNVKHKTGVDPDTNSAATIHKPSDEFFGSLSKTTTFDTDT